jgi:hypothetical protein
MSYPKNPKTIIIKNKYYPRGLRQIDIWNHYQKYKLKILKVLEQRPIMLFIFLDGGNVVVRRQFQNKPIILNKDNYDRILHGRTVSLSVETGNPTNYFCIDIDSTFNDKEKDLKECVEKLVNFYKENLLVNKIKIYLSANSYHVYGYLKNPLNIDVARNILEKELSMRFSDLYDINSKMPSRINLDLTPMYDKGTHTVPFSLSRNGLIYQDITKNWKMFNRKNSIVRGK